MAAERDGRRAGKVAVIQERYKTMHETVSITTIQYFLTIKRNGIICHSFLRNLVQPILKKIIFFRRYFSKPLRLMGILTLMQ